MMTFFRRQPRKGLTPALGLILGASLVGVNPAFGQKPPDPPPKEVTDGFFDVPARESEPSWGLPQYLVTAGMAGAAIFILCKSARRG